RPLSEAAAARRSDEAGVVQGAVSWQPAPGSHLGEVHGSPPTAASSPPTEHGPDLGGVTTSHIDGRAGWWKAPCPALARGWGWEPSRPPLQRPFPPPASAHPMPHATLLPPCPLMPAPGGGPHAPRQRLASAGCRRQAAGSHCRARTGRVAGDGQPARLELL